MVQCSLTASCGKALVKKMSGQVEIYLCKLCFLLRVFSPDCRHSYSQQMIIQSPEKLSTPAERLLGIRNAEIQEGLSIADEIYRLSGDGAVLIISYPVAVVYFAGLFQAIWFSIFSHDPDKTCPDRVKVPDIVRRKRFLLRDIKPEFPTVVEHQPMVGGLFVYKRCLPVRSMVSDILERGRDHPVKIQAPVLHAFRRSNSYFIHSDSRGPLHIPVKSHPRASPALESESICEMAAFLAVFQKGKPEISVHSLRSIHPEYERRNRGLLRIRIFRKILNRRLYCQSRAFLLPFPLERLFSQFGMFSGQTDSRSL